MSTNRTETACTLCVKLNNVFFLLELSSAVVLLIVFKF